MQCREFNEIIDSYLKDELLTETNHDVIKHLEGCPACRRELTARRELRAQLRRAFEQAPDFQPRPEFAFQLRNKLKQQALGQSRPSFGPFAFMLRPQWVAATACLIVALFAGVMVWRGRVANPGQLARIEAAHNSAREDESSHPNSENDLNGAAVRLASFEVTEQAVGDHQNCAIKYNLMEEPISLLEAGRRYDRADFGLASAVRSGAALRTGVVKYVEDHSCIYHGRRFAHIVLKYQGRTVSLLVAEADEAARKNAGDDVIACSSINGYQVSCFGTKRHTVFVVSDLSETDNLKLARALAPTVASHLKQAEA